MDKLVDIGVINVVGGGRHDIWNMHYMPSESLVQAVSHNHELRPEVMSDLTYEEQPPAPPKKQTIVPKTCSTMKTNESTSYALKPFSARTALSAYSSA